MDCEHGWRNAADCDACTRARVMPSAEARIAELEAALADALSSFRLTQQLEHYPPNHWSRRAADLLQIR